MKNKEIDSNAAIILVQLKHLLKSAREGTLEVEIRAQEVAGHLTDAECELQSLGDTIRKFHSFIEDLDVAIEDIFDDIGGL